MSLALLSTSSVSAALTSPYWRVSVIDETSSTQSHLKENNPKFGDVLATEYQSAGRGRLDRSFEAKKSTALLFSFYVEAEFEKIAIGFIPLIVGLAVQKSISKLTGLSGFTCKWPNDLLFGDKKLAGILCEKFQMGVIVGIGINVSMKEDELPVETATSIFLATGKIIDRNLLLAEILKTYSKLLSSPGLIQEYEMVSSTLGESVRATLPNGVELSGLALKVDESGALHLDSGEVITVGDLIHIRR